MKRPRCTATTRAGDPCRNYAVEPFQVCGHHGAGAVPLQFPPEVIERALAVLRRQRER